MRRDGEIVEVYVGTRSYPTLLKTQNAAGRRQEELMCETHHREPQYRDGDVLIRKRRLSQAFS